MLDKQLETDVSTLDACAVLITTVGYCSFVNIRNSQLVDKYIRPVLNPESGQNLIWIFISDESTIWDGGGLEWPTRIFCRCTIKLEIRRCALLRCSSKSKGIIAFLRPSCLTPSGPYKGFPGTDESQSALETHLDVHSSSP